MSIRRTWSDVKQMRLLWGELLRHGDDRAAASWEITSSAQRFAHRTKSVVDDKLTLSATLMRAGEVDEANRLLAEVERDVRSEEAALMERVNEVRVAQAIRRERLTRTRLAGTLAAALVGSSLLAFSAVGVSLASMLRDKAVPVAIDDDVPTARPQGRSELGREGVGNRLKRDHRVRIAGVKVALTTHELAVYRELTSGEVDPATLEQFLYRILPASVAQKIVAAATSDPVQQAEDLLQRTLQKADKKRARAEQEQPPQEQQPAEEPSPQPSPSPQEDEDEPADDPSDEDKKKKEDPNRLPLPVSATDE